MEPRRRIRRPEPQRTAPIRSWMGVYGGARGAEGEAADPAASAGTGGAGPASGAPAPDGSPIGRGVELGYRLIDEYLRQGMQVARAISGRAGTAFAPGDWQDLAASTLRFWSELSASWLGGASGSPAPPAAEAARAAAANAAAAPAPGAARPTAEPGEPPAASSAHVAIDVASPRAVEVTLDLRPGSRSRRLRLHDLRSAGAEAPRLRDVTLATHGEDEPLRVRIRFPDAQPAGTYLGVIVDEETSLPRGTLCVRIAAE